MANIKKIEKKIDERGWLVELLKWKDVDPKEFGQILITVAKSGITKGNHYHHRKKEWFCVIRGKAKLILRNLETQEEESLMLSEDDLQIVEILPNIFHSITNIGEGEMHLLAYVNEVFDPQDPDTFYIGNED